MNKTIVVYGDPKGEHLRLERHGDRIDFISAEARGSRTGITQIRDRYLCDVPITLLREILREEGDD